MVCLYIYQERSPNCRQTTLTMDRKVDKFSRNKMTANLAKNNQWKSLVETNTSNHDLMDFLKRTMGCWLWIMVYTLKNVWFIVLSRDLKPSRLKPTIRANFFPEVLFHNHETPTKSGIFSILSWRLPRKDFQWTPRHVLFVMLWPSTILAVLMLRRIDNSLPFQSTFFKGGYVRFLEATWRMGTTLSR